MINKKHKILITGANGLVASRVVELWQNLEVSTQSNLKIKHFIHSEKHQLLTPDLNKFNLLNKKQITNYLKINQPDTVIHFAAYTDVREAEKQRGDKSGLCWQINVKGTEHLLKALGKSLQSQFIYISTDMVFSGTGKNHGPYAENHPLPTNFQKLSWYGWTKAEAEKLIQGVNGTIVRLIYPVRADGKTLDYIRRPLKLFKEKKLYPLFDDQIISITFIDQLAEVLEKTISNNIQDQIFHASTPDTTTPYELIKYTLEKMGKDISKLKKTSIENFLNKTIGNETRYPIKTGLKSSQTAKTLGINFLNYKKVVDELIKQGLDF